MKRTTERAARRQRGSDVKLSMTPMIDVVFLLLVFFLVAVKPIDLVAALGVVRPKAPTETPPAIELPEVRVTAQGYAVAGRPMTVAQIGARLARIRARTPTFQLVIVCDGASGHAQLVRLLDTCAGLDITNIALLSRP